MFPTGGQREKPHWANDYPIFSRTTLQFRGTEWERKRECHKKAAAWAIPSNLIFPISKFFSQTSQKSVPVAPQLLTFTLNNGFQRIARILQRARSDCLANRGGV